MKANTRWKNLLIGLLGLQVVVAVAIAVMCIVNFPALVEQFGVQYQTDMGMLQALMVYNLFLSAGVCFWGIRWIRKGNAAGVQVSAIVGVLMFLVSTYASIQFDRIDMLLFDGVRAFLMVLAAAMFTRQSQALATAS